MKTEITLKQLYWNPSVLDFFFREQSKKEFENLVNSANDLESLFNAIEDLFENLDEFEEFLYNDSLEEIQEYLGSCLFVEQI